MPMSVPKKLALAAGGAGALALAVAVPAVAFAQDPTPTPSSSTPAQDEGKARGEERRDKLAEALAKELGLEKEKVAAALDKVDEQLRAEAQTERQNALKERLATAVTEGKLTQEQADAILKAAEAGVLSGGPDGLGGRGPGRGHR